MWKAIKDFLSELVENLPILLVVSGIVLFALGAAGGLSYNSWFIIQDFEGRLALMVGGGALIVFGVLLRGVGCGDDVKVAKYGLSITHPATGDMLERRVTIRGEFKKVPPKEYQVRLLRIYPRTENYYPMGQAVLDFSKKTWEAPECDLGGSAGDVRIIGVYLTGKSGQVMLDYFKLAEQTHGNTIRELEKSSGKKSDYLPLFSNKTKDMFECHRVTVNRK